MKKEQRYTADREKETNRWYVEDANGHRVYLSIYCNATDAHNLVKTFTWMDDNGYDHD